MNSNTLNTTAQIIDFINNLKLTSARLTLKKFSSAEVEINVQHEMNPELMRYIRDPLPIEKTRRKTVVCASNWCGKEGEWSLIAVRELATNAYIGIISFRYESIENDTVEIGWRLAHEFQGKGYATEASQAFLDFIKTAIKPHKVVAYCVAENLASSKIMTKLNMQKEGQLRQFCRLGGKWHDEAIYGLILDNYPNPNIETQL
ncbi:MAG: GNAT family N-acetyltransferase [Proteobacteria bacterium]|nr:GNAT family N-acetyltransferase [Pseudomonadota bacterium]